MKNILKIITLLIISVNFSLATGDIVFNKQNIEVINQGEKVLSPIKNKIKSESTKQGITKRIHKKYPTLNQQIVFHKQYLFNELNNGRIPSGKYVKTGMYNEYSSFKF